MVIYKGKCIHGGVAIGKVSVYTKGKLNIRHRIVKNTEEEVRRFTSAQNQALQHFENLYQKTLAELGGRDAAIFDVYKVLLEDESFVEEIKTLICTEKANAEYAVIKVRDNMISSLMKLEDDYLRARVSDIEDVSRRLILELCSEEMSHLYEEEPVILLVENLTPSEVMQLDRKYVQALVIMGGAQYSHATILAGNLGIPVILYEGSRIENIDEGKNGALDGDNGLLYIEPNEELINDLKGKQKRNDDEGEEQDLINQKISLAVPLKLCANICNLKELQQVKKYDADGIGLFRTEFVFMEKSEVPTEEEQFQIYQTVLEAMGDKEVIIRTLDIGADKQCKCFGQPREENPALGVRGIRASLKNRNIFRDQIKALLRASVYGTLGILYPMITSQEEVNWIKELVKEVKEELEKEGKVYGNPKQGIMIETPAAVMISDLLAKEVDFFSIGTNDLTQYTLAMDRQSSLLSEYYNPYHPAILRMIELVVENAHKQGIKVSVCGELSADLEMTKWFLQSGVDELSVAVNNLMPLKRKLMQIIS